MICWSCERAAGDGATCAFCGAIQPPDPAADWFRVFGIEARYDVDLAAAEARFRELSRVLHPDKFATADARARRASLQRTVQLNEAWRTLKDPVRRAEYMLERAGYEVGAEAGASRPVAGGGGARERIMVPPVLLAEILELREELGDARAAGDDARVQHMARDMRARSDAAIARVAAALDRARTDAGARDAALGEAAESLIAIRYFRRFLDEVTTYDDESQAVTAKDAARG